MSGTWYFLNFFFVYFHDFCLVLPSPHSFHSVSLSRKDKTCAIDYDVAKHNEQTTTDGPFQEAV